MANEKRLIDANVLLESVLRKKAGPANIKFTEGFNDAIGRVRSMISSATTVDAVEVVHGRWIEKQVPIPWCEDDVDVFTVCSVCDCCSPGESNYCPNCGAKMDGERRTEE